MPDLQSLRALHDHLCQQRDGMRALVQQAEQALRTARSKAEQLLAYRSEYQQRWQASFQRGGEIQIVMHYQSFMARLSAAIEQQQGTCLQLEQQQARLSKALVDSERRVASTARLIERRRQARHAAARRSEQKQMDELATRVMWARRAGPIDP
jgi:flagellar FliJ protein